MRLRVGHASEGRAGREINEDSLIIDVEAGVFAVADGMGGHADGGVASRSLIEVIRHLVEPGGTLEARVEQVNDAVHRVNEALYRRGSDSSQVSGTTLAALVIGHGFAVALWAGDSRVYLMRAGRLYQLTTDHATLVATGGNRHRSLLTRAVGSAEETILERVVTHVLPGDRFLICSDGITKNLSPESIADVLEETSDDAAGALLIAARNAGSKDDATAIVVDTLL